MYEYKYIYIYYIIIILYPIFVLQETYLFPYLDYSTSVLMNREMHVSVWIGAFSISNLSAT